MSWLGQLDKANCEAVARRADPWRMRLGRLRGTIGDDGLERVTTQMLLDLLENSTRQPTRGHLPAPVQADGRAGLDRRASPWGQRAADIWSKCVATAESPQLWADKDRLT
jgi:hypothetical protein